jgi:hypothetical protein
LAPAWRVFFGYSAELSEFIYMERRSIAVFLVALLSFGCKNEAQIAVEEAQFPKIEENPAFGNSSPKKWGSY